MHISLKKSIGAVALVVSIGCTNGQPSPTGSSSALERFPEPRIGELVGLVGDEDTTPAALTSQAQAHNQALVRCMRNLGFDGFPLPQAPSTAVPTNAAAYDGLSEIEFAQRYGFGISTLGVDSATGSVGETALSDYIAGLDEDTQQEFVAAYSEGDDSCLTQAVAAVENLPEVQAINTYSQAIAEISEWMNSDPRVVQAHKDYATCMASAGQPAANPKEAVRIAEQHFFDWLKAMTVDPSTSQQLPMIDQLSDLSRQDLETLRIAERNLAIDSLQCETPIRGTLIQVWNESEANWITENGDKLRLAD